MTARTSPFEVLTVGTMSAGKSTFLNALIGRELLPVANEATTAHVTRIEHRPRRKHFSGSRYFDHEESATQQFSKITPETIRKWNADEHTRRIELSGTFNMRVKPTTGFVLYDTPGANNSQDNKHRQVMLDTLDNTAFHALFYVLNAHHLGVDDDRRSLEVLLATTKNNPERKIWFILNKVDALDPEKGETISSVVNKTVVYLRKVGFEVSVLIPVVSHVALYAKKSLAGQQMSRKQRGDLNAAVAKLNELGHHMLHAARIPEAVRELWRVQLDTPTTNSTPVEHLLAASGIVAAEAMLYLC
jgi:ribosome biogenesis GTPase A